MKFCGFATNALWIFFFFYVLLTDLLFDFFFENCACGDLCMYVDVLCVCSLG